MTTTPNYGALLQSFWTPPTTYIVENPDSTSDHSSEPTDIIEFLGEDLLWQQTIPAQEPD
jgi:DEAD/DEAH box helicase domain-containing protein